MVKLSKEAKQRLQQLFKGGQFAIRWGFIPLLTLGIKDYLVIWFWKQSMQRNNMEGVRCGWDKRWDIVQTFTSWMAQGSYFSDASVAEWNLY
ncbi:hypothetical protein E2I00_003763 [Balaenoptera physalus]|uniref:Uncharacterized protein n=1 Tax=Balaenoptera physalus TaxID=9770 RepID=A0A6A1Q4A2_BALPH|nr:hypothetical protein E2I00_003763 [Balaenoptera physalus]